MADIQEIKRRIGSRWLHLLLFYCPELLEAIRHKGKHVRCLMHTGKNGDGFRLFPDADVTGGGYCNTCGPFSDGFKLFMALKKWTFKEALSAVESWLKKNGSVQAVPADFKQSYLESNTTPIPDPRISRDIKHILSHAKRNHPRVSQYLQSRGLSGDLSKYVGFMVDQRYYTDDTFVLLPAMVACFQDSKGRYVGIQRTYLDPSGVGKARVSGATKKFSALFSGG